jgi:branched-chain amino acid transport system permease protein
MTQREHLRNLVFLAMVALVLAVLPQGISVYLRSFALFTMMYVVLALSWNIISGFTGYTSFGHVAFYGIGAYACAILVADYSWPWVPTLFVGALVAGLVAVALGYPVLRLKGPYFAIAMLGAAEGTRSSPSVPPAQTTASVKPVSSILRTLRVRIGSWMAFSHSESSAASLRTPGT